MHLRFAAGLLALLTAIAAPLAAQGHDHDHPTTEAATDIGRLGRVDFANSGAAAAQPAFQRGITLLHSFLGREAREAFREAQRVDPRFVMAYWGEAWSADDSAAVDSVLRRLAPTREARRALARTERERAYLDLAERFGLLGQAAQDTISLQLSEAWRAIHEAYPDDDDAALWYALSLAFHRFRESDNAERTLALSVQAAAVIEDVFRRRPDHPGAAHYLIHAYDDARLAPLGLRAARAYANIAPGAYHAVHMPSHIFFHFGSWPEVVASNERAWALSRNGINGQPLPPDQWDYHAADWLHYGYLQQGRVRRATALADSIAQAWTEERLAALPQRMRDFTRDRVRNLRARTRLELKEWDAAYPTGDRPVDREWLLSARGAAARRDTATVGRIARRIEQRADSLARANPRRPAGTPLVLRQVRAFGLLATGDTAGTIAALRAAADSAEARPRLFLAEGPERAEAGSTRVILGELLLETADAAGALAAFDRALELSPRRSAALLGRARALTRLGRADDARRAYQELLRNWPAADPDLPGLAEARAAAAAR
ncbi:MAG TPA: hypothetical protein VGB15_16545 [Longimicrobium sp.]|jgi:tetratricopeptide (TPR) repeat protein